jgi:hypothetical protein
VTPRRGDQGGPRAPGRHPSTFAYAKVEAAYEFVSAGPLFSHRALLDRATGEVLLQSESGDPDEFPARIDAERYLPLPSRAELGLGRALVISFVEAHLPDALPAVLDMFGRTGAYSRFKDLLDRASLVDQWYAHEGRATEAALRAWCASRGIALA